MTMTKNKKPLIIAACITAAAALVLLLALVSCSNQSGKATSANGEPISYATVAQDGQTSTVVAEVGVNESTATRSEEVQEKDPTDAEARFTQEPIDDNRSVSSPYDGYDQPQSSPSAPQKHWVEDTEQVWIEETAAWTEQVPIYGTKEVSICNICNTDVTGNATAHGKAHMLAGEGSGHHSETRQTVVGYDTVSHEATGRWETRVVGGHWE